MFTEIHKIDWSNYTTCFGSADPIPQVLMQTFSGSAAERDHAWYELWHAVCHQGTLTDCSLVVIPFLGHMLTSFSMYQKDQVACLVASLATGVVHANKVAADIYAPIREQWPRLSEDDRNQYLEQRIHDAIEPFVPLLYPYLCPPYQCRDLIAIALTRFPSHTSTAINALNEAISLETNDDIRQTLNLAVVYLSGGIIKEEYRARLFLE